MEAHQLISPGQSYHLNADTIGDEPHWDDTARDTIHIINTFQERMPPPIICIGQSWGGYIPVSAALLHPRLFAALVAMEPFLASPGMVVDPRGFAGSTMRSMAKKKDTWPSREEARRILRRNPYFRRFDKDVFDRVIEMDIRPTGNEEEVKSVTPKSQEVGMMVRLIDGEAGKNWSDFTGNVGQVVQTGFYRSEPYYIMNRLADVRPPVLYVFGTESKVSMKPFPAFLKENTGIGDLGSGGPKKDMVDVAWVHGSDHPLPFEKPDETAKAMVPWIQKQIRRWIEDGERETKEPFYASTLNPSWLKKIEKL
jgi:pimeloyl-ACP methyl ester carboxylesterase